MKLPSRTRSLLSRRAAPVLLVAASLTVAGCFDKPGIEESWTRIDLLNSNIAESQSVAADSTLPVALSTRITYRSILTGYAVAELRASSTVSPADVVVGPNAPRLRMAQDIDRILQNSVTCGRAIRAVTGWDHLMQGIDFAFNGTVPAGTGPSGGLFLLCYLGSGQKIELPSGADTVIVTPFPSTTYQVLPIGMGLVIR
jgi:hypothetical protein